jgi:glycosyltransferase involved in cell wall biosynthesis
VTVLGAPDGGGRGDGVGDDGGVVRIAFAGRITAEKGLDVVLEALARLDLREASPPVELRIAGVVEAPEHWRHCQALAEAAMRDDPRLHVRHVGHLDAAGVDELFAAADVVVVPSRWPEPLGVVAAEALRAGAFVVASAVGGLDTYLAGSDAGVLVPPGDVDAWADALRRAIVRPRRQPTIAAGSPALAAATMHAHLAALDRLVGGPVPMPDL